MDLLPNSEEEQIADAARKFLQGSFPVSRLHKVGSDRFDEDVRRRFAELGWFGLGLSPDHGGAGCSVVEEALFYVEMGKVLGPTGVLPVSLAAKIMAYAGDQRLAAALVEGRHAVALIQPEGEIVIKNGAAHGPVRLFDVVDADLAIYVRDDIAALIEIREANVQRIPCWDKSVSMAKATLGGAPVIAAVDARPVAQSGRIATAAMLVGVAEAALKMIVDYAKIRETFGRPIGAYQAVRHPCADMVVRCEAARSLLYSAAVCVRDQRADADIQLSAAKVQANNAGVMNVDWNIQLHGGIAVTDEHDSHLFLKRAHLLARWFGSDRQVLAEMLNVRPSSGIGENRLGDGQDGV